MHGKSAARAQKRGHPTHNSSSSEYSSASSSEASAATESDAEAQHASPVPHQPYSSQQSQQEEEPDHPDGYPTSDDSQPEDVAPAPSSRGHKGPPEGYDHYDHQQSFADADPDDGAPTQSESDDDDQPDQHSPAQHAEVVAEYDEYDEPTAPPRRRRTTEYEGHVQESPSASPPKRRMKRSVRSAADREKARKALWEEYEPLVAKASQICESNDVDPMAIAYARLVGAGKGIVDFIVRLRSITIGRLGHGADCQIRSETRCISRRHAELYWDNNLDHWMMTCLSEKNGMVVDGAPIAPFDDPVMVKSRSLVEIGDVSFFFLSVNGTTFRCSDIPLLEEKIQEVRLSEYRLDSELVEVDDFSDDGDANDFHQKANRQGKGSSRTERVSTAKKPKKGEKTDGKKIKSSARKGSKAASPSKREPESSSSDSSESEAEDETMLDFLDDSKYKLPVWPPSSKGKRKGAPDKADASGKKRRKKGKTHAPDEEEGSDFDDDGRYEAEWNKKEKTDFTRALFAVGVDAIYDEDRNIRGFDWRRFRYIAEFPKKSDHMLEDYYRRVMADVHGLLDEEEREKKAKGPRTKHKPGCECNICENARRARKKRRKELGVDERDGLASDEDAKARAAARSKDRLVGLVTAQKLRVRIGIHEAARRVDSEAGEHVFARLRTQEAKEMPSWWRAGDHDRELMRGCEWHGVGQWTEIWYDESLALFNSERQARDSVDWPSNQAAMKRVRELASAIISEMKRLAKRDAQEERVKRRIAREEAKRVAKRQAASNKENGVKRKRSTGSRSKADYSADEYEEVPEGHGKEEEHADGESTMDESGSDRGGEVEIQEEDGAATEEEEEVEMAVEEDMDIEPEYEYSDDGQEGRENEESDGDGRGEREERPEHGASTEDEEDGEQNQEYGTVSDSGSE